ncbi:hypothetical protein [Streptomyces sp. NPDC004680]|uniref:hypothetical protein n=1 Tax=Streptomyces sp. NPDC004680 TaxID=3154287 RepID=UPI0033B93138
MLRSQLVGQMTLRLTVFCFLDGSLHIAAKVGERRIVSLAAIVAAIAVVLDRTTAATLYDPKDPFNEAVAAFYVQASGKLGDLYAPVLSLTAGDAERPGLLSYVKGLRFIHVEAFDTDAAVAATELLRFGHSWAAVHAARPSATHPTGRFLLTLTPKAYAGTGIQAVHPGQ